MPFSPHIRITAIGDLGTTGEHFSYGFNLGHDTQGLALGDFQGFTSAQWTDLMDSVKDFHGRADSAIHPQAVLKMVKAAAIGSNGKYMTDPIFREYSQAGTGPASNYVLPQNALVVTLDSARRGPTGRGRFYVPMPAVSLGAGTFLVGTADADNLRNSAATMLNDINNTPGLDFVSGAFKVVVSSTKGYNSTVNAIRVGRLVDTMRSRRRQLLETYGSSSSIS